MNIQLLRQNNRCARCSKRRLVNLAIWLKIPQQTVSRIIWCRSKRSSVLQNEISISVLTLNRFRILETLF